MRGGLSHQSQVLAYLLDVLVALPLEILVVEDLAAHVAEEEDAADAERGPVDGSPARVRHACQFKIID